jgi:hypothetical protein
MRSGDARESSNLNALRDAGLVRALLEMDR